MDFGWIQLKNKAFIDLQVFITAKFKCEAKPSLALRISGDDNEQSEKFYIHYGNQLI